MKVHRLQRHLFVIIALLAFLGVLRNASAADEPRVIRVGAYQNAPKIFRDSSGTISGVFPDILDYIARQEHWRLEYVFGTFTEGLERLKNGEINLMVDVAGSEERAAEYDLAGGIAEPGRAVSLQAPAPRRCAARAGRTMRRPGAATG